MEDGGIKCAGYELSFPRTKISKFREGRIALRSMTGETGAMTMRMVEEVSRLQCPMLACAARHCCAVLPDGFPR
jgi:hypothetical protein